VIKPYYIYFTIIVFTILISCKNNKISSAYFSGQIANPKEKYIHLIKNNNAIISANLNNNSNFSVKIDSVTEGLFLFKHGNEIQYIYLQPNDSLVMRLNTWDFDESLIFSGKGSIRNNFLTHLFLENEKQEKSFYKFHQLNEAEFKHKADSLTQIKLLFYKQFKETNNEKSKKFESLINLAIYYPIYSQMEKYATKARKNNQKLSDSYYNFRKNININENEFHAFYAYQNYIKNYFINKANETAKDKNISTSLAMLPLINNELKNSEFKNKLLQSATINCLLDESCSFIEKQKAINLFYENCKNETKINEIRTITNSMQFIQKGYKLPKLNVVDFYGNIIKVDNSNIKQNSVIYFWPKERTRIKHMFKRLKYLEKRHPNIKFIGIDGQLTHYNWKAYIKSNSLNEKNQFQLKKEDAKNWFCNELPRAILIDKNGIIKNNFSYISQKDFENLLNNLSKN
jgi:hypothetical protein